MGDTLSLVVDRLREFYGCAEMPEIENATSATHPYSVVQKVRIRLCDESRVIYIKTLALGNKDDAVAGKMVSAEYAILQELYSVFERLPKLSIVRPVAGFPERGILVTEEVPGDCLMEKISDGARAYRLGVDLSELESYCYLAGRWLRCFQGATDRGGGVFDIDALIDYCDARLGAVIAIPGSGIDKEFRSRLIAFLYSQSEQVDAAENRIVGCHNDYSPHNMITKDGSLTVLDFGYFDYSSFAYDVVRFWHHIECMRFSPLFKGSTIGKLQDSFLDGYGIALDFSQPLFKMVATRYYLTRLVTQIQQGRRAGLRKWVDRRVYRGCRDWLDRELEASI